MSENRSENLPAILVFQIHHDEFSFLGNENIITDSSDFGEIWDGFFKKGGYDPILPYATDPKPINVSYVDTEGKEFYIQGLFVENVTEIPEGYKLYSFPASDFLVVTTEWMETFEESIGENGNFRCCRYAQTVPIPEGYIRYDAPGCPISLIEKENANTPDGSRYEVWVPIKKI